jgi:integrase/recombinase XerD
MTLHTAIEDYLSLKRSLGAVFAAEARILHAFERSVGNMPLAAISPQACRGFCRGTGHPTRWWERKHQALRSFFAFLVSRRALAISPLPEPTPKLPRTFEPYIYSRDELARLLDATTILHAGRGSCQAPVIRILLLMLYATGLRPGEGLRLRCCDVDLDERVLAIWDTKFFKSRLVPIGTEVCGALGAHQVARRHLPMPAGLGSVFFANRKGKAISLARLEAVFARLRDQADIRRPAPSRWQPRLHDLRHTFATHRLIAWYRAGADLHACLPLLATYLGHVNLSGTQAYLTMTPDLLDAAAQRFERYADLAPRRQPDV